VNTQQVSRPSNPNTQKPLTYLGGTPSDFYPLQRCEGDCDNDGHCENGLFCMQRDGNEPIPGCSGSAVFDKDYCVDVDDFELGFMLLPTGGWDADWHYSEPLLVSLNGEQYLENSRRTGRVQR